MSFKNTIIIMTGNVQFAVRCWRWRKRALRRTRKQVMEALRSSFRPRFLNRIDGVVVFQPLGLEDIEHIVDIQQDVHGRLANRRMTLELSELLNGRWLLMAWIPVYGARPLGLTDSASSVMVARVANLIVAGELHEGDTVLVDTDENGNLVARKK